MLSCPVFSDCVNKCRGFECVCYDGYEKVDGECTQICDEDQCGTSPCPANSQCVELCEMYECECDSGYTMNASDECCETLNQCIDGIPAMGISAMDICPDNSMCINTCDGYTCDCNEGYHMDAGECVEDDPDTTVPPTSVPPTTEPAGSGEEPTTEPPNPYAPSSVYEDPHFHITGISISQPDICFDYDGEPGSDVTLISDDNGVKVIGALYKPHANISEVYFDSLEIRTPKRIGLVASARGWNVHHVFNPRHFIDPVFAEATSNVVYDDLIVTDVKRKKYGYTLVGQIENAFTFEYVYRSLDFFLLTEYYI